MCVVLAVSILGTRLSPHVVFWRVTPETWLSSWLGSPVLLSFEKHQSYWSGNSTTTMDKRSRWGILKAEKTNMPVELRKYLGSLLCPVLQRLPLASLWRTVAMYSHIVGG